jgi:hypothetical protein
MNPEPALTPTAPIRTKDGMVLGTIGPGKTVAPVHDIKDHLAGTATEGEH